MVNTAAPLHGSRDRTASHSNCQICVGSVSACLILWLVLCALQRVSSWPNLLFHQLVTPVTTLPPNLFLNARLPACNLRLLHVSLHRQFLAAHGSKQHGKTKKQAELLHVIELSPHSSVSCTARPNRARHSVVEELQAWLHTLNTAGKSLQTVVPEDILVFVTP